MSQFCAVLTGDLINSTKTDREIVERAFDALFKAGDGSGARKAWLSGRLTSAGSITIDSGAAAALMKGNSLLAAGIIAIDGQFERSDVVEIMAEDGKTIARGLAEYDAADCAKISGHRSSELEDLLGYAPRSAVVHRNQMVLV